MPNLIYKITGKDPSALFQDAASGAKARLAANTAKKLGDDPDVKAEIKAGVGSKIGAFVLDNYKWIAAGAVVVLGLFYFVGRKGR